jgi:cytoskeletal protein CcmA (bactofilin family)
MKRLVSATLLLIIILSWATPVFAQDGHQQPGQVLFGSDLRLEAGDIVDGDVVLFGGNLRMAEGSRIQGDAVVFGGHGDINGEVEGEVAFIGGDVEVGPAARIDGDLVSVGGQVSVDEAAHIDGEITGIGSGEIPLPPIKAIPPQPRFERSYGFEPVNQFFRIMLAFMQGLVVALVVSAIGLLAVLFLPRHSRTVGKTITQETPASFGVGLLTLIVGITAMVLLFVTCCLIPIGLLLGLALALATLYGWIVVGYLLGGRILRAIQKNSAAPTPVASALVGIFTVTLVQQGLMALSRTPCLGFFFWIMGAALWLIIASTGLGAVVLTRFGTQPYTRSTPPSTPPTALPSIDEPEQLDAPDEAEPKALDETN